MAVFVYDGDLCVKLIKVTRLFVKTLEVPKARLFSVNLSQSSSILERDNVETCKCYFNQGSKNNTIG